MKILAIRGRNLASLAGDFAVDFDAPPLAGCGLFAITGRTGAGKSTLLDALCLALYQKIPRLEHAEVRGVQTDERPHDPRTILRRGAAEGYAEVDFRGCDRRRYRSRWSVRRARNKPDGKLQAAEWQLIDLDDDERQLSCRTSEMDRLMPDKLGLSFEQFRRAVLLAQGDFAAFLKARQADRADLLERITGTEIYGELSKAAHQRERSERERLASLERDLATLGVLDAESRATLDAGLLDRSRERGAALLQRESAARARQWHDLDQQLQTRLTAAEQEVAALEEPEREYAARHAALDTALRLEPLRRLNEQLTELERRQDKLVSRATELAAQRESAIAALAGAGSRLDTAAAIVRQGQEDAARLAPELDAARRLDHQLDEARRQQTRHHAARDTALTAVARREQAIGALTRDRQLLAERQTALQLQRQERAGWQTLAEDWPRWQRQLHALADARQQYQTLSLLRQERARTRQTHAGQHDERATRLQALTGNVAECQAAHARAASELAARPVAEWDAERQTLRDLYGQAQELGRELVRRDDQARQIAVRQDELAGLRQAAARAEEEAGALQQATTQLAARLAEAQLALDGMRAAAGLDELRATLQPGQPCLLCGSPDHPWAGQAMHTALHEQARRLTQLRQEHDAAAQQYRQTALRLDQSRQHARLLEQELHAQLPAWQLLDATCRDTAKALDLADDLVTVQARLKAVEQRGLALGAQLKQADELAVQVEARRQELERLRQEKDQLERQQAASRDEQARLDLELARQEEQLKALAANIDGAGDELATALAVLPDWQARLDAQPALLLRHCEDMAAQWLGQRDELAGIGTELSELAGQLADLQPRLELERQSFAAATADAAQADAALAAIAAQRQACLNGEPVERVLARQQVAHDTAQKQLEAARASHADATRALDAIEVEAGANRRQQAELAEERAPLYAQFVQQQAASGFDRDALPRHWAAHPGWIDQERAALAALADTFQLARQHLSVCRQQVAEHRADGGPGGDADEAARQLDESERRLEQLTRELGALEEQQRIDEQKRREAARLQAQRDAQQAAHALWAQLSDLIGSADGRKFRQYAQSLTLDALLAHANLHLGELSRRYRLRRTPDADLDLQVVDRDMADEVRSVHSLSGGESFLVSLALALGLASLSSRRTQVDSLFIDEGFGSLDPDTLMVAMDALDNLQASGRQVGVISHVGALTERIAVQVKVVPHGGGASRVSISG